MAVACAPIMRGEKTPGSFAWFDLITNSPQVSKAFYGELFDWRFAQGVDPKVEVITHNRALIGGLVTISGANAQTPEARWQPVLSVDNTPAASHRARAAGGRLIGTAFAGPTGTLAALEDPTGAKLTLYDGNEGVPLGKSPEPGSWVWVDLLSPDTHAAKGFYQDLADFQTRREPRQGIDGYWVFTTGNKDRGGLIYVPRAQASPMWLPYVLVRDLDATIAKATDLGAKLAERQQNVAILIDPAGAAIGLAQHAMQN